MKTPQASHSEASGQPARNSRFSAGLRWLCGLFCVLFVLALSDARHRGDGPPPPASLKLVSLQLRVVAVAASGDRDDANSVDHPASAVGPADQRSGEPLAGVDVRLFRDRAGTYEYVAQRETGADGRASAQVPAGDYWVVARVAGRARKAVPLKLRGPHEMELALEPAEELGIVVRDGERPVPLASVVVKGADELPLGGATDHEGRLRVGGLSGGTYDVRVVASGYEVFETTTREPELEVRLRRTLALRVLVRDEKGLPVPHAEVRLSGPQLWPTRRVDTNAQGEVTISGLASGSYDVLAQDGTRISEMVRGVDLRHGSAPGARTVELVLREGRFLSVRVVDAEGEGVAQADLVLSEAGLAAFPLAARTDREGRGRLGPLRWHQAHLAVRADGFVPRSIWVGHETLAPGEPLEVELVRGGTIVGRVLDDGGYPIEGVALEVIGTDLYGMPVAQTPTTSSVRKAHFAQVLDGPVPLVPAGELGVMPGPVPPIPLVGVSVSSASAGGWTTDGTGHFTAQGVSPGELRVLARHPDFVETVSDPIRLQPGGRAEVEVVLRPGRRVEGRVIDARGFPVAHTRLRLQATRGAFDRTVLTGTDGTFAVAAAPKELVLSVFGLDDPLRVLLRRSIELSDDPAERLEIELPEARADVHVEVVDDRGEPVAVAQVTLLSLDPEVPLRETRFSAENGSLEIRGAAGVHARILVDTPGFSRLDKVWPELSETVRLQLSRAVQVAGRVTAVRGRQPAGGARVVLRGEGLRRETRTNQGGEYTLSDVPPGRFTVTAEHPDLGRGGAEVRVVRQDHERPFEVPLIDLVETATVRGRVIDSSGNPVEGARVTVGLVPSYLPQGTLPAGMVVTNSGGEFTLDGVEPGRHTVSAYAPALGRGSTLGVAVESGGEQNVEVRITEPLGEDAHDFRGGVAVTLGERDGRHGAAVVIVHVAEASEAERAGLQAGDVLSHVDGVAVHAMADARRRLGGPAGSDVVLALRRSGKTVRTRVTREALSR